MNHTNSLLSRLSAPGLWLMKSRNIVDDISRHIHDLAVDGGLFLQVYSPHKDRIVSNVISMIIKDLQLGAPRCVPLTSWKPSPTARSTAATTSTCNVFTLWTKTRKILSYTALPMVTLLLHYWQNLAQPAADGRTFCHL